MSRRLRLLIGAALLGMALVLAAALLRPPAGVALTRERAFDLVLGLSAAPVPPFAVVVVDIGAQDDGGRPWDRAATARLAAIIAAAGPRVIGHDIVYSGDCGATAALARAVAQAPTVLAALLAAAPGGQPLPASRLILTEGAARGILIVPGAELACPDLTLRAAGVGSAALFGDVDARIRSVPMLVAAEGRALDSLALSVAAVAMAEGGMLSATPGGQMLRLGPNRVFLGQGAGLRLDPANASDQAARTVAADAVLAGAVPPDRFAGAVVLIGSSLPQRGGLRPTAAGPLTPSVQIQADLVLALLTGSAPRRPAAAPWAEAVAVVVFGLLAVAVVVARWPPAPTVAVAGVVALGWGGLALALFIAGRLLLDPVLPPLAGAGLVLLALIARAVALTRAERSLRARIAQQLPAAIVARLIAEPGLLRLTGERREVTALFTDIEGFSTTARNLTPEALVAMLDAYFTLTCAIVLRHGGMVDKIVGDSVHALFNAPLDQPGHAAAAIACAAEIVAATEAFRAATGIGRTRAGIESGPAILGDIGAGGRIDYTAHGDVVNLAARLQEVNKETGIQVLIGPGAASQAPGGLRALGPVSVRSFGTIALFTLAG